MEIAASLVPRIVRLALIGVGAAFAWIVVSLVLGLGLGQAHADDGDGLLGGALDAVTETVDATASSVADTVTSTVTIVTAPAADLVSRVVVSDITQSVIDVVTQVPIVGDVATGIGLDDAVSDLGGAVDETVGVVVGIVQDPIATVIPPPTTPVTNVQPDVTDVTVVAPVVDGSDATAATLSPASASTVHRAWGAASITTPDGPQIIVTSAALPRSADDATYAGGLCLPASTSSAGPGGAGPGAWAFDALDPLDADRAWVRRAGPEDDHAPPAPVGSTDVSPD